ncbi:polysaccharide deacetylase family protein [Cohnella caldifontis]|uniref:polysaccharide deacetylase family protein n=1 Tax=Cohnella caldifontis TaxID=3027471 RepID=UPI0023EDA03D|nr:polysaccharide deacetylase family protein [Cohnella sp. YIM B05605]
MGNTRKMGTAGIGLLMLLSGCASANDWGFGVWAAVGAGGPAPIAAAGSAETGNTEEQASYASLAFPAPTGDAAESARTAAPDNAVDVPATSKPETEKNEPGNAPGGAQREQPETDRAAREKADTAKPKPKEARKVVALTFDDGPDGKYTPKVLDILKEHGVKATFFLVGTQVEKYPDTAKRIMDEGHDIGNHSWSHQDLAKMTAKQLDVQILQTQDAIEKATGYRPDLVRAPNGSLSDGLISYLHDQHLSHVYWTVDPRDWAGTSVATMRENVRKHTRPGGIILLHSFGGRKNALDHTLKLLPLVIEDLKKAGYEFGTVDEMIGAKEAIASAIR